MGSATLTHDNPNSVWHSLTWDHPHSWAGLTEKERTTRKRREGQKGRGGHKKVEDRRGPWMRQKSLNRNIMTSNLHSVLRFHKNWGQQRSTNSSYFYLWHVVGSQFPTLNFFGPDFSSSLIFSSSFWNILTLCCDYRRQNFFGTHQYSD